MTTPLQQMTDLWRGIARLHRSDAIVQEEQRRRVRQQCLGLLADNIAGLMTCYSAALEEADACDSSRAAETNAIKRIVNEGGEHIASVTDDDVLVDGHMRISACFEQGIPLFFEQAGALIPIVGWAGVEGEKAKLIRGEPRR